MMYDYIQPKKAYHTHTIKRFNGVYDINQELDEVHRIIMQIADPMNLDPS